jgi:DNA-binding transcriptional LysR family regulator
VRGNSESHVLVLTRAGLGVGLIDDVVGGADSGLRRVLPGPVDVYDVWADVHGAMPRVRAMIDFLAAVFAAEANLFAGRRPLGTKVEDMHG